MIPFSNSPTCVAAALIVVCGMKPLSLTTRILSLRSTSGKIGEQDISAKEKKIAEEDLKLNYCGMCFTIVVSTFSIHFGPFSSKSNERKCLIPEAAV